MSRSLYAEAKQQAIERCMTESDDVLLIGALFGGLSPHQHLFDDLDSKFPGRVLSPPTSELGLAGIATGAATQGMRPMLDVITASFAFQGFAQIVNEAANVRYMSNGASSAPVVFHMLGGIRSAGGPQHSHRLQSMFWNTPGLDVLLPSTPQDVYDLMTHALLYSQNPTVFIDHPLLLGTEGEVDTSSAPLPVGKARVLRTGDDVTLVASSILAIRALQAADILAAEGIEIEVIDPRTLVPFDEEAIVDSVRRTGRLVVADETNTSCGCASEIITRVVESAFEALSAPPVRISTPDVPIPFASSLEQEVVRSAHDIAAGVRTVLTKERA